MAGKDRRLQSGPDIILAFVLQPDTWLEKRLCAVALTKSLKLSTGNDRSAQLSWPCSVGASLPLVLMSPIIGYHRWGHDSLAVSITSYNHLANNDGKNLSSQKQFRSKEISKSNVVDDMVEANSLHRVGAPCWGPDPEDFRSERFKYPR
ncbi:hypothetical protein V8F33_012390 [Rhypophila sp. PSN 637]